MGHPRPVTALIYLLHVTIEMYIIVRSVCGCYLVFCVNVVKQLFKNHYVLPSHRCQMYFAGNRNFFFSTIKNLLVGSCFSGPDAYTLRSSFVGEVLSTLLSLGVLVFIIFNSGRSGQQIRNAWKVLKCGAGEGWRRSVGPIM